MVEQRLKKARFATPMAWIPKNAKWYLADLIMHHQIASEARHLVHINLTLIRADSPEQAYTEAERLGHAAEITYENSDSNQVQIVFRGLMDLNVIHDKLEHGAELAYTQRICNTENEVREIVTEKAQLTVFRHREASSRPNYMPKSIDDELKKL
jgi:hypothetical protein